MIATAETRPGGPQSISYCRAGSSGDEGSRTNGGSWGVKGRQVRGAESRVGTVGTSALTDGEAAGLFLGHSAAFQQQCSEGLRETRP